MPRIRKKTSKRISTHQRAKFKHKVAEGRKKKKKEAKKNPQWKSKKKTDPGIPNNFPYKDQILAEVAETRRQAEEAKQRRKEEKKVAREGVLVENAEHDSSPPRDSSSSRAQIKDEAPLLLNPDLPDLNAVLKNADVVLLVLDARDPASYRLSHIEELAKTKLVFILNKIDLVPREALIAWVKNLRKQHTTFLFHSASSFLPKISLNDPKAKGKAKESTDDAVGADTLLEYLGQCASRAPSEILQVAVVGLTNSGKSAIVNSLARKAVVPVYSPTSSTDAWRTTTTRAFEVQVEVAGHAINVVDTPGVSFELKQEDYDEKLRTQDMVLRSRGRVDKVKDPVPALEYIVSRADTPDLMVHYNLPAFAPGDCSAFLAGVARACGLLKKGGHADLTQAARTVLRDWTVGKLPFYTDAPKGDGDDPGELGGTGDDGAVKELCVRGDGVALGGVRTRREMWKGGGVVRIGSGEVERRRVVLDVLFVVEEAEAERAEEAEEAEGAEGAEEEDDDDDDDDDDDEDGRKDGEESENDLPAPLLAGKRKRRAAAATPAAPPPKKVAFAAGTRDRKERQQARSASKSAIKATSKLTSRRGPPPKVTAPKAKTSTDSVTYDFDQFFKS